MISGFVVIIASQSPKNDDDLNQVVDERHQTSERRSRPNDASDNATPKLMLESGFVDHSFNLR